MLASLSLPLMEETCRRCARSRRGPRGYLLKSMLRTELIDTIRLVHAGHRRIPQEIAVEMAEHVADDALTGRGLETLRAVACRQLQQNHR